MEERTLAKNETKILVLFNSSLFCSANNTKHVQNKINRH